MTAVTGVRAHQVMLDVTGNNIANVNTTGYKKDFTLFQDLLYQTTKGATGPGDGRGGVNPMQVGLGVKVGGIETIHSQGFTQYTGNKSDMMIEGEGYFILREGNGRIYTRAGNFTQDAQNDLVHSGTGYKVQGYKMERDPLNPTSFVKAGDVSDINIPFGRKMDARATTLVGLRCNLDSRASAYLPIGYADIPYVTNDAKVTIGGTAYNLSFQSRLNTPISGTYQAETLSMSPSANPITLSRPLTIPAGNTLTLGAAGMTLPAGTSMTVPSGGMLLPAGASVTLPAGTTLTSSIDLTGSGSSVTVEIGGVSTTFTDPGTPIIPSGAVVPAGGATIPANSTFAAGFVFPGGTIFSGGTAFPGGTIIPAGVTIPANTQLTSGSILVESWSDYEATDYFTITISDNGQNPVDVPFKMVGINNGYPQLELPTTPMQITMPDGSTVANVVYDDATGLLQFVDATPGSPTIGATLWRTNLHENMTYNSFSVTNDGERIDFIAEFDESNMGSSPIQMTLWWENSVTGQMGKSQFNVTMNPDGTFNAIATDPDPLLASTPGLEYLPPASTAQKNLNPAATGYSFGDNFKILIGSQGKGLEFQATNNSAAANATPLTAGNISQGGMHQTKLTVYDCQGFPYTMEVQFKKLTSNRWRWEACFVDENGTIDQLLPTPFSGEIKFDDSCHIISPLSVDLDVPFSLLGRENSTIKLDFSGQSFGLDVLEGVTQFASSSTTKAYYQDGYTMGILNNYNVSQDGTIMGSYDNGQNQPIARIALAQFANPMGLDKIGNSMFRETINSGTARIDAAMEDGSGSISGGNLEMSNVDLTEEFTRLIISQRGFQANTRVVTTSDQILEEVVNMKR
jgi:flagellar hook protein FlgE